MLKALHIELEEVRAREHALREQHIEPTDLHFAHFLPGDGVEPALAVGIHGARGRIGGIEIEGSLFVYRTGRNPVIMAISLSRIALRELIHRFCNGVEPMHHEVVAELMPSRVLAVLHADIDENKRLLQIALLDDPLGKRRVEIVGKLHTLSPSAARTILRVRVRAYYIAFSSLGREALSVVRSLVPARRSSQKYLKFQPCPTCSS